MREIILNFPKQFPIGVKAAEEIPIKKISPSNIIISGMGGSALPGDLLKLSEILDLPIVVWRDYFLCKEANENSLIISISYSGNTEETLSFFAKAQKKKFKWIFGIGSGGKLMELSKRFKIPFAKVPSKVPPRLALGYQFSALIGILRKCKILSSKVEKEILLLEKKLDPKKLENEGKILAKKILGKIPLVYSSSKNWALARIWKINFNENSKTPSFFNVFPELNHNEMTGIGEWKNLLKKKFFLIILEDEKDDLKIKKRMKILSSIFSKEGIKSVFVKLKEEEIFEKIFSNIILSYWTSYFLAIFSNQDPIPIKLVEKFKKMMKKI